MTRFCTDFALARTVLTVALLGSTLSAIVTAPASAQIDMARKPVLTITNDAMPATVAPTSSVYSVPPVPPEVTPDQVSGAGYFSPESTVVGHKVDQIRDDLFGLQSRMSGMAEKINSIQSKGQQQSATYNAGIATISTALQSGTTPGNPRLVQKLSEAQQNLDAMTGNVAELNALAVQLADLASMASFLLDTTRASYSLSGAIEEDHSRLKQMEDQINNVMVNIDRLLTEVNDDITRTAAFLSSERENLRVVALGVTTGDMYGRSLSNRSFNMSGAGASGLMQPASYAPMEPMAGPAMDSVPGGRRPLAKIRFDQANVNYEQPVYLAVSEAMNKYPNARFEIVAVHPTQGNAAQLAIESTKARRNAEAVMRSLGQMGLPLDKVDLLASQSPEAQSSEVHIYVR
jgi:hypothetical protein